jgi:spoIIIJ-associated protein
MEEVGAQLEVFLSGLTDAFGFNGPITIDEDDEGGVLATVDGQHGLMVGPKGRTLEAIQELARVSAQRTTPSSIRIKVDVGGYRSRRQAALESFAQEVAAAAKGDGKERSMEPMSSADRKIVHDALSDMPGIETRSAGAEPRRRVVVVPVGSGEDADGGDDSDDSEVDVSEEAEVVGN